MISINSESHGTQYLELNGTESKKMKDILERNLNYLKIEYICYQKSSNEIKELRQILKESSKHKDTFLTTLVTTKWSVGQIDLIQSFLKPKTINSFFNNFLL
jgi:hypothetical protein